MCLTDLGSFFNHAKMSLQMFSHHDFNFSISITFFYLCKPLINNLKNIAATYILYVFIFEIDPSQTRIISMSFTSLFSYP